MKEQKTIYGILGSLCSCRKTIRCRVRCIYSDGEECSVFSVCFYESGREGMTGKISFSGETGKVFQFYYKEEHFSNGLNIIDSLLDLYNIEKGMFTESGSKSRP